MARTNPTAHDHVMALLERVCEILGYELRKRETLTDAEKLRRLERRLEEKLAPAEIAKIKRDAWGTR